MYGIIRMIIGCVFFVFSVIIINRSKLVRKHIWRLVSFLISLVVVVVLILWPFENYFVTFKSLKTAYEYYYLEKSNIVLVVEGDNCDYIIDRKTDVDHHLIIPKTADGWKTGPNSNTKRIFFNVYDGVLVRVYQYKNTSDYFIAIRDEKGGKSTVSDEYNTKFYSLEKTNNDNLGKTYVTYYGHITDFNPQYSVTVNGKTISFDNQ